MSRLCAIALLGACVICAPNRPRLHSLAKQAEEANTGPKSRSRILPFDVNDHNGRAQTFDSLCGPKGLGLLFDRGRGFGVAALTYDTVAILRSFANRSSIVCTPGGFTGGTIYVETQVGVNHARLLKEISA